MPGPGQKARPLNGRGRWRLWVQQCKRSYKVLVPLAVAVVLFLGEKTAGGLAKGYRGAKERLHMHFDGRVVKRGRG
jgi:hypothetical protein